jgi:hypothetical protein
VHTWKAIVTLGSTDPEKLVERKVKGEINVSGREAVSNVVP